MKPIKAFLLSTSLVATGTAMAADKETLLASLQGQVMVNQGQAYVAATESMLLYPGDRLMVLRGGSAQLQFANGCLQTLQANEITTVSTGEACNSLQAAGTNHQLGGPGTTTTGGAAPAASAGVNPGGVVIAAMAAGGIAYGIDQDNEGDRNDRPPASP